MLLGIRNIVLETECTKFRNLSEIDSAYSNMSDVSCGETYSTNQGWIEGALETSRVVIDKLLLWDKDLFIFFFPYIVIFS